MKYILNNDNLEVVGKQYLQGIGGYDGYDGYDGSKDVATVINDKADKTDIVTPDWNAQEGEAGYIENKPNINTFIPDNLEFTCADEGYMDTGGTDENGNLIECFVQFDDLDRGEYKYHKVLFRDDLGGNKYDTYLINHQDYPVVKDESLTIDKYPNYSFILNDDGFWVSYYKNGEPITDEEVESFNENLQFFSFAFIDMRNVISINSIIFKDITDFQKNQALSNLGIDPVALKYTINPLVLNYEEAARTGDIMKLPEDLANIVLTDGKFNQSVLNMIIGWDGQGYYRVSAYNNDAIEDYPHPTILCGSMVYELDIDTLVFDYQ